MVINGINIDNTMCLRDIQRAIFGKYNEACRRKVRALLIAAGENPDDYVITHRARPSRHCLNCGKQLTKGQYKYCSRSCSATARNKQRGKTKRVCLNCGQDFVGGKSRKFCCAACSAEYGSRIKYQRIVDGAPEIMRSDYSPTRLVYKYILKEQDGKCAICGIPAIWNDEPLTFIVDHIDGDASNNKRSNLRCICPNCDSQLETFKNTKCHRSTRKWRTAYKIV